MRRKRAVILGLAVAAVAAFVVIVVPVIPWGERQLEIDLNNGRLRTRVFVAGLMVREEEKDTPFSRLVVAQGLDGSPATWKTASVRSWPEGRYYECYRLGSALGPMRLLPEVIENTPSLQDNEAGIVKRMLDYLRRGDTDSMNRYMTELVPREDPSP